MSVCLSVFAAVTDALHAPRDRRSGDAAVIRAARRLGSGTHTHTALLLAGADGRLHVGIQTIWHQRIMAAAAESASAQAGDGGDGSGGGGSATGAGSSTEAPLDVAAGAGAPLAAGMRVRLEGLVAIAELNGRRGVVLRYDESKQRHVVSIRRGDEAEEVAV